ncbi:glycosyltransferase family 4 protein [Vogesella indigofera]|uniref:glycosyltransferase family 4 protein n=1 Tax=Vogesella indigofera TaxID=45465 RepID=UPI00234E652C|nr:glycosyltransferase family 4 protein [Vogesella indigofera]MDC7696780.1 glycosyltransferase family 4 protein [Vogesella indigofera]
MFKSIFIIQPAFPKYRTSLFDRLRDKFSLTVFACKKDFLGVESVAGSPYVEFGGGFISLCGVFYWHKGLSLVSAYKEGDVVVVSGNPRIINYMLLMMFCRLRGIEVVWWGHGWSAGSHGLMSKIRIRLMCLANKILVYTDFEKEKLGKHNCFALNNGLDKIEIQGAMARAGSNRSYESPCFDLVFVGRVTEKAGLSVLIHALPTIDHKVRVKVVGDGALRNNLQDLASILGVADRIDWLGPVFDENVMAPIMLAAHAFVYPGAVGLSLIHAFNYGLPAIIHSDRSSHMPEFAAFSDGENGFAFVKDDADSLASVVNQLVLKPTDELRRLSEKASLTVRDTYHIEDMVDRFSRMITDPLK